MVEIDETKIGKRKNNRGRPVDGVWVFGGIERGTKNMFLYTVAKRDANTLLPLIFNNVERGNT